MVITLIDPDFIKRARAMLTENLSEHEYMDSRLKWQKENPEKQKQCQKKYNQTEKGKQAIARRTKNRNERLKKAWENISPSEKCQIDEFYRNCPDGYEVDHIIPLALGGTNHLSNLQYLTPEQHREKHKTLKGMGRRVDEICYVKKKRGDRKKGSKNKVKIYENKLNTK